MTNLTVSNALIISLGGVAYQMAQKFQQQVARRHPDIPLPTLRFLPLLEEEMRLAEQRSLPGLGVSIRPNDPAIRKIAQYLYPNRQFPESQSEMARVISTFPRPRGQIALHHHIYNIAQELREARRAMFSSQTLDQLSQSNIQVANPRRVQVFILTSLSDAFMSGFLPDLPFIVQQVLKEAAPEDTFVNVNLVMAMPGFKGDVRERDDLSHRRDYARMRREASTDMHATAAACLREVDYYLANSHRYSRRFSRYLKVETDHHPLGEGRIFLLEPTNEQEKTLDDINALTSMVAEWLYHVTMTPLREQFEAPVLLPTGRAYSSFGHSSLSVPIGRWIERMTVREQIDLLSEMLDQQQVEEKIDIATTRSALHITESELKATLVEKTMYNDLRLQPLAFRNVPLASGEQFLARVQGRYTDMMTAQLPETRSDIHYRKRQLTSKHSELEHNLVDDLEAHVLKLLDDPRGGIIKAHMFLEALRDDLRKDRDKLRENYESRRKSAERMGKRIEKSRGSYIGRANVAAGVGSVPFVWLSALLVLGALPVVGLALQWTQNGTATALNWGVLATMLVLTGLVFGRTFNTLRQSRFRVVKVYDERLQAFRETDLQEALIQLYDDLIQWTGNFRAGVNRVWQQLIDVRTELNTEWGTVSDPKLLAGLSSERISEYLLTPTALRLYEKKLPLGNFADMTEALRSEVGTPGDWIQDGISKDELADKLNRFCRTRVSRELQRYNLQEAIKNIPEGELISKFHRVFQLSYPWWRNDPTRSSILDAPWQVVAVSDSLNLDLPRLFGADLQTVDIQSPYEIVVAAIRHGFGLHEMTYFSQILAQGYGRAILKEQEMLHTTEDRLVLPDPQQEIQTELVLRSLPLRQLYGVARALDVLHIGRLSNGNGIECSWAGETGRETLLAQSPVGTLLRMEADEELQQALRSRVTKAWQHDSSVGRIHSWTIAIDDRHPEFWARLAVEDFAAQIDDATLVM